MRWERGRVRCRAYMKGYDRWMWRGHAWVRKRGYIGERRNERGENKEGTKKKKTREKRA
jgi:hypothetical protein